MSTTENGFATEQNISVLNDLAQVLNAQDATMNAEVEHTGGGIFGVTVKLNNGHTLLCSVVDEQWVTDYFDKTGELVVSSLLDIPGGVDITTRYISTVISSSVRRLSAFDE